MDIDVFARLGDQLRRSGFGSYGGPLGPAASASLDRDEVVAALRTTADQSVLSTLVRLWVLQTGISRAASDRALPGLVDALVHEGVLAASGDEVRAVLDVRVEEGLLVASDPFPGLSGSSRALGPDHVLGASPAARTLRALTVRRPTGRALDLGCGSGLQALGLARHAEAVVATDVNPRALWLTRLNAALNGVDLGVREGSFYEPVAGDRFDLVVSNPPYVISPPGDHRLVYREAGTDLDGAVSTVVGRGVDHLTDGGLLQVLASWVVPRGGDWQQRVGSWLGEWDCWVVQREVLDPASYVELWLKDAGVHGSAEYRTRYDHWLSWLDERDVEAIGFGWVFARRDSTGRRLLEEWPYEVALPFGEEVRAYFDRPVLSDAELLGARLRTAPEVVQETFGPPGAADPERIVVRRQTGLRRAQQVDTVEAGLLGAADGDLTVGQILDAIGRLTGTPDALRRTLPRVRELLAEGFLLPEDRSR